MLILDTTTNSLQVTLGAAPTTNQLPITASYVDITTTSFTPIAADTITTGTTAVTIVASPSSSTQRQIKQISIQNADTVAATVTVTLNDNSTLRNLTKTILNPNDTLQYNDCEGFFVIDGNGCIKQNSTYPVSPATTIIGNSLGSSASPTNLTLGTHLAFSGTNLVVATSGATAGTYGGTALIPQLTVDAQGIITLGTTVPQYVSVQATFNGTLVNNETLFYEPVSIPFSIGSTAPNCYFACIVNPSTSQQFLIQKNSSTFGTVTIAATTGSATYSNFTTTTSFALGDKFGITLNGTADTSFQSPAFSFQGTKA